MKDEKCLIRHVNRIRNHYMHAAIYRLSYTLPHQVVITVGVCRIYIYIQGGGGGGCRSNTLFSSASSFQGSRGASVRRTSVSAAAAPACTEATALRGHGRSCTAASLCCPGATTRSTPPATSAAVLQEQQVLYTWCSAEWITHTPLMRNTGGSFKLHPTERWDLCCSQ